MNSTRSRNHASLTQLATANRRTTAVQSLSRVFTLPVLAGALLAAALQAQAQLLSAYDLDKTPGSASDAPQVLAYGGTAGDHLGRTVLAGDINGDGTADLIVGSSSADPIGRVDAGAVYVWFGKGTLAGTKDAIGTAGTAPDLSIYGAKADDFLTWAGALTVGDVNGDGTADLLLGASQADGPSNGRSNAGKAYIVYGRKSPAVFPTTLDLALQGSTGADVTIYGATTNDQLSVELAVGDLNGDGTVDLILGAHAADGPAETRSAAGEAYIVFGRQSPAVFPATLDLAVQGSSGADVTLYGATSFDQLTTGGLLTVGDVNGDGTADLLIGTRVADGPAETRSSAGEAYIVYGRRSPAVFPATLDLALQGSNGADVTIYGATSNDLLTNNGMFPVGDVNGDGTADLLLGTPAADGPSETRIGAGEAYIVYGRKSPAVFPATLDLSLQGSTGADVTIYGATAGDSLTSGGALTVGDVNGDGTADLILGATSADGPSEGRTSAGEAYIVYGRKSPAVFPSTLDLALQGSTGADVTLYGATGIDQLTRDGALTLGDLNGDGTADLILGATSADGPSEERFDSGEAYIVYGRKIPAVFPVTLDLAVQGSTGADVTIYGATANDQLTNEGALTVGDVNGDRNADLILGAIFAKGPSDGRNSAGEAYVVFGLPGPQITVSNSGGGNLANPEHFGSAIVLGAPVIRSFILANSGNAALTLSNTPRISLTGPNAADFRVSQYPASSVAPGQTSPFSIAFDPKLPGLRQATVRIAHDGGTPVFEFDVTGFGSLAQPRTQTISFAPPSSVSLNDGPLNLLATASSGLPVTLALDSGPATLEGNTLTLSVDGTVKIIATQPGGGNYAPAKAVTRSIVVKDNPTTLTLQNLAQVYNGTPRPIRTVGGTSPVITYKIGNTFGTTAPDQVGTYDVRVVDGPVTKTGKLVIAKAVLTVTPRDERKFAGQVNPPLTFDYGPFQGTDTFAVITKAPVLATTAQTSSPTGLYPITAKGAVAANYNFNYLIGTMVVESFVGNYEALLADTTPLPVAKLTITVPAGSTTFTAKLANGTTTGPVSFKGALSTNVATEQATGTATTNLLVNRVPVPYVITFTLPLVGDVTANATRNSLPIGTATDGQKLLKLAPRQTVNYAGAHTVLLEPAAPGSGTVPVGAGWATASISPTGLMTLKGKLGDGTDFTSTLSPDTQANPGYRLFVQPYKPARTESYLVGSFALAAHPNLGSNASMTNRRFVEQATITWKKSSLPTDTSYRTSFGPVNTVMMLDPWLPPIASRGTTPATTLAQRLALIGDPTNFTVNHSNTGSTSNGSLPTRLNLTNTNVVSVLTPLSNSTKWKTTIVPSTGTFSGTFELLDGTQKRPVSFSGILRQPADIMDGLMGAGHYLLPPLSGTERTTGEVMFIRPTP